MSFLELEQQVVKKDRRPSAAFSDFLIGPFGSAFTVEKYTEDRTYRYIRGKDVRPLTLMDNDNVYMPKADYDRLSRYALREKDVLVSVVGTLGNAALVTRKDLPAVFSCKSTAIRPSNLNPVYLTVYLNCRYGRNLLVRKERGAIQKGLNLDDLRDILIFEPSAEIQKAIERTFNYSLSLMERSKDRIQEAEGTLLAALRLADWTPPEPLSYSARASEAFAAERIDAQYFMPTKSQVRDALAAMPGRSLGARVDSIRDMFAPDLAPASNAGPQLRRNRRAPPATRRREGAVPCGRDRQHKEDPRRWRRSDLSAASLPQGNSRGADERRHPVRGILGIHRPPREGRAA